jgi:hypothetical protein
MNEPDWSRALRPDLEPDRAEVLRLRLRREVGRAPPEPWAEALAVALVGPAHLAWAVALLLQVGG